MEEEEDPTVSSRTGLCPGTPAGKRSVSRQPAVEDGGAARVSTEIDLKKTNHWMAKSAYPEKEWPRSQTGIGASGRSGGRVRG